MSKIKKQEEKANQKPENIEQKSEAPDSTAAAVASGINTASPCPSSATLYFREFLQHYLEHQQAINGASSSDGYQDHIFPQYHQQQEQQEMAMIGKTMPMMDKSSGGGGGAGSINPTTAPTSDGTPSPRT